MKISKYFTVEDFAKTRETDLFEENLKYAMEHKDRLLYVGSFYDQIYDVAGQVFANSTVRCPELNGRVKGSSRSFHKLCLAGDFVVKGFYTRDRRLEIVRLIKYELKLYFGKLIIEPNWIHWSCGLLYRKPEDCGKVFEKVKGGYKQLIV